MSTNTATRQLTVTIDDRQYTTRDDDQEAGALLRLAGRNPAHYDLLKVQPAGSLHAYRDKDVVELTDGDRFTTAELWVTFNKTVIVLTDKHTDGASLKAAAIAAGVGITSDFVLSEKLPNGKEKVITDDKHVTVKAGDEFWAIPGDDNS